jgi:pyruvate kinase
MSQHASNCVPHRNSHVTEPCLTFLCNSIGVNVFRLNFSHISDPETQTPIVETIRKESADLGLPVAILGSYFEKKVTQMSYY